MVPIVEMDKVLEIIQVVKDLPLLMVAPMEEADQAPVQALAQAPAVEADQAPVVEAVVVQAVVQYTVQVK